MSDNDNTSEASTLEEKKDGGEEKHDKNHDPEQPKVVEVPEGKLKGFEARVAKAETMARDAKAKLAEYEEAEQLKKGEYEELLNKRTTEKLDLEKKIEDFQSNNEQYTQALERYLEDELEKLPEDKRDLIPDSLTITEKLDQARKLNKAFATTHKTSKGFPKNAEGNPLTEQAELTKEIEELKIQKRTRGLTQAEQDKLLTNSRRITQIKGENNS